MLQKENFKEGNLSQLVIGAFGDMEKILRQELELFLLNAKQTMLQVVSSKISYNWLALCITITTVFSAFALMEGFKAIQGLPLWAVYSLSAFVFLSVGILGFVLINLAAKPSAKKNKVEDETRIASTHTIN